MISVAVNPPKTPVTEGSMDMAPATLPNICKMPGPPLPFVPTPLPNIGRSACNLTDCTTTVTIEGAKVAIKGSYYMSQPSPDVASQGTGGGIVSSTTQGKTEFVAPGSMNVKAEGKNIQLLGDAMTNNGGSPANSGTLPGNQQPPSVPVIEFSRKEFPNKTQVMQQGMGGGTSKQLTRKTGRSNIRKARRAALKGHLKAGPGMSLDEFPFASSNQGGTSNSAVRPIPAKEQNKQGGKLSSFYQSNNIKNGSPYTVKIVP